MSVKVSVLWFWPNGNYICLFLYAYYSVLPAWSQTLSSSDPRFLTVRAAGWCCGASSVVHYLSWYMTMLYIYEVRTGRWVYCICVGRGKPVCHWKHLSFICWYIGHNFPQSLYYAIECLIYFPDWAMLFFLSFYWENKPHIKKKYCRNYTKRDGTKVIFKKTFVSFLYFLIEKWVYSFYCK